MKRIYLSLLLLTGSSLSFAQSFSANLDLDQETDFIPDQVVMPASPLTLTPVFIGGVDQVQTTETYSNAAGTATAKEWHDFIGLTPDTEAAGEYWVSVNHEMISKDDMIGDGGGMTVFKVRQNSNGSLTILNQTLDDSRTGQFFNVDFVNHVGETGMNCGGINSVVDGRIWTAEEWFRTSNASVNDDDAGVRDTTDWALDTKGISITLNGTDANGQTIEKYENFNWMVEIDPKQAKAIRKQYNWGRAAFEGGTILKDNKTVIMGEDGNPGLLLKFVADVEGDFTSGDLFVYKESAVSKWMEVDNSTMESMLDIQEFAWANGATMFNRLEWVTYDTINDLVYIAETGRDDIGDRWSDEYADGGVAASHHIDRAADMGVDVYTSDYTDYYGRVLTLDPSNDEISVLISGGPEYASGDGTSLANYPTKHLSNPDGLNMLYMNGNSYLLICEDLNGTSHNRMPYGISQRTCELYMLDLSISTPSPADLYRLTAAASGAEITGAVAFPDGKTILVNSQHPKSSTDINEYPYNHSLTIAITGIEQAITSLSDPFKTSATAGMLGYPNPVTRELHLKEVQDVAFYNVSGERVLVSRGTDVIDVSSLEPGEYIVKNLKGQTQKFIIL